MTRPTLSSASRLVLGFAVMSASLSLVACSSMPMPTGYTYQNQIYRAPAGPEVLPIAKLRKVEPTYVAPMDTVEPTQPDVSVFPIEPEMQSMPAPIQLTPPTPILAPTPVHSPVSSGAVRIERRTIVVEPVNSRQMNE